MNAIVTVFRSELKNKPEIFSDLKKLSIDTKEVNDAYAFSPQTGKLFQFLTILKNNKISYGTHFENQAITVA